LTISGVSFSHHSISVYLLYYKQLCSWVHSVYLGITLLLSKIAKQTTNAEFTFFGT
jgi:hypothetical protein